MSTILEAKKISKVYLNGVYANAGVDFALKKGEIHALVGENGAGKTTLMKILYGLETPDSGILELEGKTVEITSPDIAIGLGICMVHQHFMLLESLTVAQNITLGYEPGRLGYFDYKKACQSTNALAEKYRFNIKAEDKVADLPVGLKQKVEILKALNHGAKILILDEPTAVLTPQETIEMFEQLKLLRNDGHSIIFISHKLKEVKQISDRITVMRKGRSVANLLTSDVNEKQISEHMIGRELKLDVRMQHKPTGKPVLTVRNLDYVDSDNKKVLNNINFAVRKGEIVGVAGVEGNGQSELAQILGGMLKASNGEITIEGKIIKKVDANKIRNAGLVYVPADRMQYGIAPEVTIWENLIANRTNDPALFKYGVMNRGKSMQLADSLIKEYEILCKSNQHEVGMLSGGNIQKVVVAREFSNIPRVIIAEQPTRGIDVGTAELIHNKLIELRDKGCAVFVISADLDEILKISSSIIVMHNGAIAGYFEDASQVEELELGNYMLGVEKQTPEQVRMAVHE